MRERPERYVNATNRNPRSKLGGERSGGGGLFKYIARPKKWRCFSCFCWSVRYFFLDGYIFSHVFLCWFEYLVGATLRLSNLSSSPISPALRVFFGCSFNQEIIESYQFFLPVHKITLEKWCSTSYSLQFSVHHFFGEKTNEIPESTKYYRLQPVRTTENEQRNGATTLQVSFGAAYLRPTTQFFMLI